MSISTKALKADSDAPSRRASTLFAMWLLFPAAVIVGSRPKRSFPVRRSLLAIAIFLAIGLLSSCGGVSAGGGGTGVDPVNPIIYRVTVTGTSPGTPADAGQSTVVTLVVN